MQRMRKWDRSHAVVMTASGRLRAVQIIALTQIRFREAV